MDFFGISFGKRKQLDRIESQLRLLIGTIMPNLQDRLDQINTDLNEASTEILAELENLRGMNLPPEAEASLAAIEAKAQALKNVSPPVP